MLTITHYNSDESHLSSEQTEALPLLFILFIFKCFITYYSYIHKKKSDARHFRTDYCLNMLFISQFASALGTLFSMYYYYRIQTVGSCFLVFPIIASLLQRMSEFILNVLLVLLATGYTVSYHDIEQHNDADLLFFYLFGMLILIFDGLTFISYNSEHDFHSDYSLIGYFINGLNYLMGIWFFVNVYWLSNEQRYKSYA